MKTSEELQKDFPALFHSAGITCGPGWNTILEELCIKLTELNATLLKEKQVRFAQIKEKFGQLRIYLHNWQPEANAMVNEAEKASLNTCEMCGEPGTLHGDCWVKTVCDKCWENRNEPKS